MSTSEKTELGHLLQHNPDAENGFCELCEASGIASVVFSHAMALGERSAIPLTLMAAELAAQTIEAISHAEDIDLDVVIAVVKRRIKELRTDRESEDTAGEGPASSRLHH